MKREVRKKSGENDVGMKEGKWKEKEKQSNVIELKEEKMEKEWIWLK